MNVEKLKEIWKKEEEMAHIHGWDFSHIHGRYEEENDLPWDYEKIVRHYLNSNSNILDYDTGGGEFLLSLNHPYSRTSATEGYKPNVDLCREKLLPLGINFKVCDKPSEIPYDDETFDMIINRHGDFNTTELYRLLKNDGVFITQQVGGDNDRDNDKLKQFDAGYDYVPHMTVGKVSSMELLDKAFDDVNKFNDKFSTMVKKISVEMIGEHEESIIVIEHQLRTI